MSSPKARTNRHAPTGRPSRDPVTGSFCGYNKISLPRHGGSLVCELDDSLSPIRHYYLADPAEYGQSELGAQGWLPSIDRQRVSWHTRRQG